MCGISGIIADGNQQRNIETMCKMMEHRGPDNSSLYRHKNIWLAHNRLRIIDLKTGDQPIFNQDGSIGVVFNGEIYNYLKIKSNLEASGYIFKTAIG